MEVKVNRYGSCDLQCVCSLVWKMQESKRGRLDITISFWSWLRTDFELDETRRGVACKKVVGYVKWQVDVCSSLRKAPCKPRVIVRRVGGCWTRSLVWQKKQYVAYRVPCWLHSAWRCGCFGSIALVYHLLIRVMHSARVRVIHKSVKSCIYDRLHFCKI